MQEIDRPFADGMGRSLAALPKRPSREELGELRAEWAPVALMATLERCFLHI